MSHKELPGSLHRYFLDPSSCTVIREDRAKVIMRCSGAETGSPLFIKIYRQASLSRSIRETIGRPAGEREYQACCRLRERGIPVPVPMGSAVDRDRLGLVRQSLFAAAWMEDRSSLRDLTVDLFRTLPVDRGLMDSLSGSLGRFVARLHAQGVKAYDLNAGNFLVRRKMDGSFELLLVDYEQIAFSGSISRRRKLGNLAQVSALLLPLSERAFEGVCAGYIAADGDGHHGALASEVGVRARELAAMWEQKLDERFRRIGEQRSPR